MAETGYLHPRYVATLSEFGRPRALTACGGHVLERRIRESGHSDAIGPYPIFCCRSWSAIEEDLRALEGELVSVVLVTDPFGDYTESQLAAAFPDLARPFKQHFVVDLSQDTRSYVSTAHRRNVRKALRSVEVELVAAPPSYADTWCQLYEFLKERHAIEGISAFSSASLTRQLEIPGTFAFAARNAGDVVGMTVWYVHGDVGYYHLGAYSAAGYELRASFAVFWWALEHFAEAGLGWLSLGGAAGATEVDSDDGLARFKRGWSTGSRTAYLCGRVLDRDTYRQLAERAGGETSYFPAYRAGEIL